MLKLIIWCSIALVLASVPTYAKDGIASWYGNKETGRLMANGEKFNKHALIAAHRTLPLGTTVKITNLKNNRSVIVKIKDRGPYVAHRDIDLSEYAANIICMKHDGVEKVKIIVLSLGKD